MAEELLVEVVKQTQKKYNHINEIRRITKELGDTLSRNDKVSAQLLIEMRGEEMSAADLCEKNIQLLLDSAGEDIAGRMRESGSAPLKNAAEEKWALKIIEIRKKIKDILQETIRFDQGISTRLAGDDSFYRNSKR